jgi:hypothetical protein
MRPGAGGTSSGRGGGSGRSGGRGGKTGSGMVGLLECPIGLTRLRLSPFHLVDRLDLAGGQLALLLPLTAFLGRLVRLI